MTAQKNVGSLLKQHGVSRRDLLKWCLATATTLALPISAGRAMAKSLEKATRPSVIWLSFQECTGCTESLTRAHAPTLEHLILEAISLDYHHTLQAASGEAAEKAREEAMQKGGYLLVVDGAIPMGNAGYSTIAGMSNHAMLMAAANQAAAVVAVGTCAAFGGLPMADPNPTGAVAIGTLIHEKPLVNIPGCPPMPQAIVGVVAHFLAFGKLPQLDHLHRPKAYYGETIHDRCYRRPFYDKGLFAETFDDEGARKGWCLFKLGCKGPTTYNACATLKWNGGVSFPIQSGHGCLGCSEPRFWDAGGFYHPLSAPIQPLGKVVPIAVATGAAVGTATALLNRHRYQQVVERYPTITPKDLEKSP
ncbi:MAG: hydrogenase small subunit [Magnetococcales bacterium]|nr:hydrogenase small subunit [Magnetococcales bacterium]NGZ26405.1 hydrogenase small subunit [Magnetococcales bacterium]